MHTDRVEATATDGDRALVAALRAGDRDAFAELVRSMQAGLLRTAEQFVSTRAVAEEVVQETWLGVIKGLDRFEGRSALRTWIYRILMNIARTRGVREQRSVPFSAVERSSDHGPTVDPDRFRTSDALFEGHWLVPPVAFSSVPEDRLVSRETTAAIEDAISELAPNQQRVVWLRDVEGWSAAEVCDALGLTEANQRVLLHRARARVRAAIEQRLQLVTP